MKQMSKEAQMEVKFIFMHIVLRVVQSLKLQNLGKV